MLINDEHKINFLDGRSADYTTNAQSYYDQLAKNKTLMEALALKIWEYDQRLDNSLAHIEEVMQSYSDILDGKLETFDETVFMLTQKWLNENMVDIMTQATKMVWFGLDDDGYFIAIIPPSWTEIDFDTTNNGELILNY